jgi:hypothetical protein
MPAREAKSRQGSRRVSATGRRADIVAALLMVAPGEIEIFIVIDEMPMN